MSLFDVIRYPISTPPTLEELHQLPNDLYKDWSDVVIAVMFTNADQEFIKSAGEDMLWLVATMDYDYRTSGTPGRKETVLWVVSELKQMIEDYNG